MFFYVRRRVRAAERRSSIIDPACSFSWYACLHRGPPGRCDERPNVSGRCSLFRGFTYFERQSQFWEGYLLVRNSRKRDQSIHTRSLCQCCLDLHLPRRHLSPRTHTAQQGTPLTEMPTPSHFNPDGLYPSEGTKCLFPGPRHIIKLSHMKPVMFCFLSHDHKK